MPDETKSWPFSSYDFFGYLMPGLMFSLSLSGWLIYAEYITIPKNLTDVLSKIGIGNSLLLMFIAFTLSYFIGHLIGAISHLLYDRVMIRNIIGYPFQKILKTNYEPDDDTRVSYIKILICFFLLLTIPGFFELAICLCNSVTFAWNGFTCSFVERAVFIVMMMYLTKMFFSKIIAMNKNKERSTKTTKKRKNGPSKKIALFVKNYVLKPIQKLTATDTGVEESIVQSFKENMQKMHGIDTDTNSSDIFWLASIDLMQNEGVCSKLTNWLNLYGCLRNYSCSFLLLAIIIVSNHWYKIIWLHQVTDLRGSRILLASLIISGILFLRYWIIYYSYYSKYLIRAYACMDVESEKKRNV